jgi:type IV secretory pathway VirB4 component
LVVVAAGVCGCVRPRNLNFPAAPFRPPVLCQNNHDTHPHNTKHNTHTYKQIYGPESSGKTTLALHAIAEVQKAGGMAVFIDAEHAFDQGYAKVCWLVGVGRD